MVKKVVAIGSCAGVKDILSPKGYVVEHVEQKNVLEFLRKEGVEAVVVEVGSTDKADVVISGIRHLYPGLWITAVFDDKDDHKQISQALKAGASNCLIKPVNEKNLIIGEEEDKTPDELTRTPEAKTTSVNPTLLDESKKLFPSRFYNAFFVTEYGKLEILRAERYNKNFSIVLAHIEGLHNLKKKLEKKDVLEFLKRLIKNIMQALRNCDVVGMIEDKKLIAILPETDYFGSCVSIKKLKKAVEDLTTKGEPYASIVFSSVSYPRDGKGYGELIGIAEQRVMEQKQGIWLKLGFEDKPFWEIVSTLLQGKGYEDKDAASFDLGKGFDLPVFFLDRLQEMVLQEIVREPRKKGVLYLGVKKVSQNLPILKAVDSMGGTMTKIFLVGEGEEGRWSLSNAAPLYLNDQRLLETFFVFFLREDFSYAAVCRERRGGQYSCFHTADPYLTEGLINKFQRDYSLQEQF